MNDKRGATYEKVQEIFINHPDWDASQVFREYQRITPKKDQVQHITSIQKHLAMIKADFKDLLEKGLDAPWSIGSYAHNGNETQFKLDAEDNAAILSVRKMQLSHVDISHSMSTRQALWIARLRVIITLLSSDKPNEIPYRLWYASFQYAIREKVYKLKKEVFDSRELDDKLVLGYDNFKKYCKESVYANWQDYKHFYETHIFNKDGE